MFGASPINEALLNRAWPDAEDAVCPGLWHDRAVAAGDPLPTSKPAKPRTGRHRAGGRATPASSPHRRRRRQPVPPARSASLRRADVMMGYWERPEETAKALDGGWMHTGDGGYMDEDGFVYIVDRVKDMIISGGENIYSAEVENVIAQHPAVRSAP